MRMSEPVSVAFGKICMLRAVRWSVSPELSFCNSGFHVRACGPIAASPHSSGAPCCSASSGLWLPGAGCLQRSSASSGHCDMSCSSLGKDEAQCDWMSKWVLVEVVVVVVVAAVAAVVVA